MIAISQAVYRSQSLDDKQKADISKDLYNMNNEDARSYIRYLVEHYGHLTSCVALLSALDYAKDSLLIETTLTSMQTKNPGSTVAQDYRKELMDKLEKQRRMQENLGARTSSYIKSARRLTANPLMTLITSRYLLTMRYCNITRSGVSQRIILSLNPIMRGDER